jgi:hypothetical protein
MIVGVLPKQYRNSHKLWCHKSRQQSLFAQQSANGVLSFTVAGPRTTRQPAHTPSRLAGPVLDPQIDIEAAGLCFRPANHSLVVRVRVANLHSNFPFRRSNAGRVGQNRNCRPVTQTRRNRWYLRVHFADPRVHFADLRTRGLCAPLIATHQRRTSLKAFPVRLQLSVPSRHPRCHFVPPGKLLRRHEPHFG